MEEKEAFEIIIEAIKKKMQVLSSDIHSLQNALDHLEELMVDIK